ncbi:MAG: ferritin-like domain-containing protein [Acidimicrobiales bacterium]
MEITEAELRAMAKSVDERHRDAMRTFGDDAREAHRGVASAGRRRILAGAGIGGVALAVGAAVGPASWLSSASAQGISDEDLAAFAQSVELAAVAVYGMAAAALSAATKPVGVLFQMHHQQHADAFAAVAKTKAVKGPNQKLVTALTPALQAVKDEKSALELAFILENQAAETYAFGLTVAAGAAAYGGMATILPIESEHAAVLGAALGKSLADIFVNGAFESTAVGDGKDVKKGLDPAVFPVS